MKRLLIIVFLLAIKTFVSAQTQNNFYLDFFGTKYKLIKDANSINLDEYGNELTLTTIKKFTYKLIGKNFLNKWVETSEDPNNPSAYTNKTTYTFKDTIRIEDTLDSLNISSINFEKEFKVHFNTDHTGYIVSSF